MAAYMNSRTRSIAQLVDFCENVYETFASLFSRSGDFECAHREILQGDEVLINEGNYAKLSWISGEAEKAVAIGNLSRAPICVRARYTHILSKALLKDPERQAEGEERRKEAQRLHKLLPPGRTDLEDESDAAF
ncbi:MAG: hypothetical protein Q9217_004766 [Psora testacea]